MGSNVAAQQQFDFALTLLAWHGQHGTRSLAWQGDRDPYRVWLSEVMLQQTQVATVAAYYARFLQRFPNVAALAQASLDEVLALWSGLGYYSRARHLHACAKQVVAQHAGMFPRSASALQQLPGIGASTAAAIAAFCWGERVAIFDGNVKRVLARVYGFAGDLAVRAQERALLKLATDVLPTGDTAKQMPRYTQAIMDLGATVCTPRQPRCEHCPMQQHCLAYAQASVMRLPVKTKKLRRSRLTLWLLWVERPDGAVLLAKRAVAGIWAGLYCLPVFDSEQALHQALSHAQRHALLALPPIAHALTHKDLDLRVCRLHLASRHQFAQIGTWQRDWQALGLPAPVRKLLAGA